MRTPAQITKEADKIFTKLNPEYKRPDGTFPKADSEESMNKYGNKMSDDYNKTRKQVESVRTKGTYKISKNVKKSNTPSLAKVKTSLKKTMGYA